MKFKGTHYSLIAVVALISLTFLSVSCSHHAQSGAAAGGTAGATAGALIDEENPWRGAVVGGFIGAAFGGTLAEISYKASREAAYERRTVVYESENGYRTIEADPVEFDARTNCHKVRERVWDDGKLVKNEVREVCESDKSEPVY